MTTANATGGGWDSGVATNSTGLTINGSAVTAHTGDYWWYPYPGTFYPSYPSVTWSATYSCASSGHQFVQALPLTERTLFCRKCGDTKDVPARRNRK